MKAYLGIFILLIASCNVKEFVDSESNLVSSQNDTSHSTLIVGQHLFEDSTTILILTKEIDDSQKCHSCSPIITLKRSFKDYKGNITWKEATLNVTGSWGEPGHFYLDELKENQDLLFYQGGYSQGSNSTTWINAFRIDENFFGDLSWIFDFKTGIDESSEYSIEECKSFVPNGLTPVEVRYLLDGELEIAVSQKRLHVHTKQKKYTSIYVEEIESSVEISTKTVKRELFYSLEYGNVYLDSTYESRKN